MRLSGIKPVSLMLLRELAITALLLLGVSIVVFGIIMLAPGDPFSMAAGGPMDTMGGQGAAEALKETGTWYAQYFSWLFNMLHGDFGTSLRTGLPVLDEIVRVGINTLYLTLGAMLVTLSIAVPIALLSARRGATRLTLPMTIFAYVVSALPVFWLGYIAIYIFTRKFGLFPLAFGGGEQQQQLNWLYFMLPIFVLGIGNGTISEVVRYLREEMERVFSEDYIRTALAKGASIWKHSMREGFILPVTEIIASKIPFILGGAVVVEQVFNWPGMGRLAWQAAQDRDFPVIMGITMVAAIIVRFGSMAQRVVYIIVNPRASRE